MFWEILQGIVSIYFAVFFLCVTIVFFSDGGRALDRVTDTKDGAMELLTRILIAYLWPFAVLNGDLWNVTIRGKFK